MLKTLKLTAQITLGTGFSITLVVLGLMLSGFHNMQRLIEDAERNDLQQQTEFILSSIMAETRQALALSSLVANIPEIAKRFEEGDRTWLRDELVPGYQVLERDFGARQFQFHTAPAISWLRVHQPAKYGDDLSSFRHSVVATNETKKAIQGLETGVAGLGARGIVPMFRNGRHLGSVEFGMAFDQGFFDSYKARAKHPLDAALYIKKGEQFETFASTLGKEPLLAQAELQQVLAGQPLYRVLDEAGQSKALYATQVLDYSDTPFAVLLVAMDRDQYMARLRTASTQAWLIGGCLLLFGVVGAYVTARVLGWRINSVVRGVNLVAGGDLSQPIRVSGKDEIAILAGAAETMRQQLHALVSQMGQNASLLQASTQLLSGSVESQAATSSEMSSSVAEITSTMEELSASSSQIAENSESVVSIANRTHTHAQQGAQVMQQMLDSMRGIQRDNQASIQEILGLGQKSQEISRVMEIINTLADQTRLIAFNAALEASSAGETGRRFGVVAAEIRRLADNVTQSTTEIESRVSEIQDAIGRLVVTSEQGVKSVEVGMSSSVQAVERLDTLVEDASHSADSARQISLATQQQKTASRQVVTALREIVTASSGTADAMRRISSISKDMTGLFAELDQSVKHFRLETRSAAQDADQA